MCLLAAAPWVAPAVGVYTNPPFSRYEVILERMPFGVPPPPPPAPQPTAPVEPEVDQVMEAFLKQHRLCALTQTAQGIGVGFIETTEKKPKTYFLLVNDELNGYRVVDADYSAETVVIEKDGASFTLSLDGSALPTEASTAQTPSRRTVAGRNRTQRPAGVTNPAEDDPEHASYVERLRQRREEMLRRRQEQELEQRAEVERLTGEALQKHLREYNMQLIRAGGDMGPPLPIELTPDEDAQLVEEGVLPPTP